MNSKKIVRNTFSYIFFLELLSKKVISLPGYIFEQFDITIAFDKRFRWQWLNSYLSRTLSIFSKTAQTKTTISIRIFATNFEYSNIYFYWLEILKNSLNIVIYFYRFGGCFEKQNIKLIMTYLKLNYRWICEY